MLQLWLFWMNKNIFVIICMIYILLTLIISYVYFYYIHEVWQRDHIIYYLAVMTKVPDRSNLKEKDEVWLTFWKSTYGGKSWYLEPVVTEAGSGILRNRNFPPQQEAKITSWPKSSNPITTGQRIHMSQRYHNTPKESNNLGSIQTQDHVDHMSDSNYSKNK